MSTTNRKTRTYQEKEAAYQQLRYEKHMLDFTMKELLKKPDRENYAVLMESFLIHVRILNDFFYGLEMELKKEKRLFQDDIIVEDLLEGEEKWLKPQSNKLSNELIKKINNQLTHLTYKRVTGKYGDWDFEDIYKRMSELVDLFFQKNNI